MRGIVGAVNELQLRQALAPLLSEKAARLFEKPPLPIAWVDAAPVDEIFAAVESVGGEAKVVQLGRESMRHSIGPLLTPIFNAFTAMFGKSPAVVMERLDKFGELVLQGTSSERRLIRDGELELHIRAVDKPARAWLAAQGGTFLYICDRCDVTGVLKSWKLDEDGSGATYHLLWTKK